MDTPPFDERSYLAEHSDVAAAVRRGEFKSGYEHYVLHGRAEGRLEHARSRETKALHGLARDGRGIEIGPSHRPLAPKRAGFDVRVIDVASAADLRTKYTGHEVDLDAIEEVDFIWKGEPLPELVGETGTFDWIIASHVIEHVPDFVSFLRQCQALLREGGKLSLIVPDKRYCFDYFCPYTTTGEVLDAFAEKRTRPTPGKVFDHFATSSLRSGNGAWGQGANGELSLIHTFEQARTFWQQASSSSEYIDVHCWRFTPESFRLLIADLHRLDLLGLHIASEHPTEGCEFFATLVHGGVAAPDLDRLAALGDVTKSLTDFR